MADENVTPEVTPEGDNGTPENNTPVQDTPSEAGFTQADIDRAVKERLARERKKFADYGELKAAADELAKLKEAQLTDQERLQKQLAEVTETLDRTKRDAQRKTVEAAIISVAAGMNFNDPADAVSYLSSNQFDYDDAGNPIGVEDAVKALAEQKQYLIKNDQQRYLEQFNPSGDTSPQKETDEQRRARLYGSGGQLFNIDNAAQQGGGVVWNTDPQPK